ncbi:MAG: hypothetical protein Q8O83_02270 [bacterium]|nr:hypothetical protein [bacterium]
MIIYQYHTTVDMAALDEHMHNIRERRKHSATRKDEQDILFVCEPKEMFSLALGKDADYIKDQRRFEDYQQEKNIPLITLRRGGGIFWHGPGQLCLCPVVDIKRLALNPSDYTAFLEDVCIELLRVFGIYGIRHQYEDKKTGKKKQGARGVWTYDEPSKTLKKIAFLGWSDRKGIAIHGCAINISCDLHPFSLIHTCNLEGVEATSVKAIRGDVPSLLDIREVAARIWGKNIASLYEKIT